MNIYVASSWRNARQPEVVQVLRSCCHSVYDFRNPVDMRTGVVEPEGGFGWNQLDPAWQSWTPSTFRAALDNPRAVKGFRLDHQAMEWADACVMVQPCGRSAHLELGWFAGRGKLCVVLLEEGQEPELMLREAHALCVSIDEMINVLEELEHELRRRRRVDDPVRRHMTASVRA